MFTIHSADSHPEVSHPEVMAKRSNKWIEGIGPDGSAAKAARVTISRRLRVVRQLLQAAACRSEETTEHVHQLRVSTRRAMAALGGYAELLPKRKAAKMEKRLRQIRKHAGAARDYDVLLERLLERNDADRMAPLTERIVALRVAAQGPIVRVERKLRQRHFGKKIKKLVNKIRAPRDRRAMTFQDWARVGLSRNVAAFFTTADGDLNDIHALHAMRIEGKLLRYAVEYSADAFGPELRSDIYPEIERLQGLLGRVNDHASALVHYETWKALWTEPEESALLEELIHAETEALREARQEFFRWWTPQKAAELKRRFAEILDPPRHEEVA